MPAETDKTKQLVTYVGIGILAAALGAVTVSLMTSGDEERPPIIVQGGSVEINVAWADDTNQNKGNWKAETGGKYSHQHGNKGPNKVKNIILNGTCTGGDWRTGGLKISLVDPDGGIHTAEISLNKPEKRIEIDPKGQTVTPDGADSSHLTIRAANGKTTRITRIESLDTPADGCNFAESSQPVLIVVQRK